MTPQRFLLFLVGLFVAAGGVAYCSGVFDRNDGEVASQTAAPAGEGNQEASSRQSVSGTIQEASNAEGQSSEPDTADQQPATESGGADAADTQAPVDTGSAPDAAQAQAENGQSNTPDAAATSVAADVIVPSFDLLRVEPDGSVVIAGRAAPKSTVEIVAGSTVLATAQAGDNGDFATVLDRALKPGDHTVVLRSITPDRVSATSLETAIISVPTHANGDVVALVQQPGQPSRLISVPEAREETARTDTGSAAQGAAPDEKAAEDAETGSAPETSSETATEAAQSDPVGEAEKRATAPAEQQAGQADQGAGEAQRDVRPGAQPFIEAVEIDGRQVFVAGRAEPGRRVRVYINDILLGQATVDATGHFLIQTERDLPVGDYIVRADVLGNDGVTVISRAAVPFARHEGESQTSVAPAAEAALQQGSDATAQVQPALERQDGAVIIRKGDTLWHISRRVYGRGIRYTTIYQANKDQIRDPNLIWPGQMFKLPAVTEEGEEADLTAIDKR